jgi:hypothetical protein
MAINNASGAMAAPADYAERRATTVRWRIFAAMPTISREFALSPALQGVILSAFF